MPKGKAKAKKVELNPADFDDFGDFMRAKKGEAPVESASEEVEG